MAKYVCPSCGKSFNGKKCGNCLYEHFTEEIGHGLHTHKGEPLVIDTPRRLSIPRKDPFSCEKPRKRMPKWFLWLLVFLLLDPLMLIAEEGFGWIEDAISTSTREPEVPEVLVTEDYQVLFSGQGVTLYASSQVDGYFPLILENTTGQDLRISARKILADGFLSERSYLYGDAPAGKTCPGGLVLDAEDLQLGLQGQPGTVEAVFYLYDADSYEDILEGEFTLQLGPPSAPVAPQGQVLLDSEALLVHFLGYQPSEYAPETFSEGTLLLYLENKTEKPLSVYADDATVNSADVDLGLWCELPGNTRTVTRIWLYPTEDLGLEGMAKLVTLHLMAYSGSETLDLGPVTFSLP